MDLTAEEPNQLIFHLKGDTWTVRCFTCASPVGSAQVLRGVFVQDFPRELQWMTYLKEWHVSGTRIRQLPDYLAHFTQLSVLHLPKNAIAELPPDIGESPPRFSWMFLQ